MSDNESLSDKAKVSIVQCLEVNNTLKLLWLPICTQFQLCFMQNIKSLKEDINKKGGRGCQVKLKIKFYSGYMW